MKTQEAISSVIDSQFEGLSQKSAGISRELLKAVPVIDSYATIITGLRRSGKSTLLLQLLKSYDNNGLYLNFEDIRLSGFEPSDFSRLNAEIERRGARTLYFDEIQGADSWEIFINQKLNEQFSVFVTGSNASLLSRELGTHLTGRHLSVELFPFSFREFLALTGQAANHEQLAAYLQNGGLPEFLKNPNALILQTLVDDIIYRDIAVRYNIRDTRVLRELIVFLISNIGKPVSARSLSNTFGIKSNSTITEYFAHFQEAYLVEFIPIFDYSYKTRVRNPKKVYAIDTGIYNQVKTSFTDDWGRQLENMVFLHLRRRYKEIFYYRNEGECDFVVSERMQIVLCLQVCYQITDMNLQRELNGLVSALKYFGLREGTIVTFNQSDVFETEGLRITAVPAHIWFLNSPEYVAN